MYYNFAERSFLSSFVDSHPRSIFEASDYSWFASLDSLLRDRSPRNLSRERNNALENELGEIELNFKDC